MLNRGFSVRVWRLLAFVGAGPVTNHMTYRAAYFRNGLACVLPSLHFFSFRDFIDFHLQRQRHQHRTSPSLFPSSLLLRSIPFLRQFGLRYPLLLSFPPTHCPFSFFCDNAGKHWAYPKRTGRIQARPISQGSPCTTLILLFYSAQSVLSVLTKLLVSFRTSLHPSPTLPTPHVPQKPKSFLFQYHISGIFYSKSQLQHQPVTIPEFNLHADSTQSYSTCP